MELLGMERLQLQTRSELETLRQEARAAQVTVSIGSHRIVPRIIPQNQSDAGRHQLQVGPCTTDSCRPASDCMRSARIHCRVGDFDIRAEPKRQLLRSERADVKLFRHQFVSQLYPRPLPTLPIHWQPENPPSPQATPSLLPNIPKSPRIQAHLFTILLLRSGCGGRHPRRGPSPPAAAAAPCRRNRIRSHRQSPRTARRRRPSCPGPRGGGRVQASGGGIAA
jgi:hypothetical protein